MQKAIPLQASNQRQSAFVRISGIYSDVNSCRN